jgi:hypothetical protein
MKHISAGASSVSASVTVISDILVGILQQLLLRGFLLPVFLHIAIILFIATYKSQHA